MQKRDKHTFLLWGGLIIFLLALFFDWWPLLRGFVGEWHWPYQLRPISRAVPTLVVGLITWIVTTHATHRHRHRPILWLALFGTLQLLLQFALVYADTAQPHLSPVRSILAELTARVVSNGTSGYLWGAVEIAEQPDVWGRYDQLMPTFASDHPRTHPPAFVWLHAKTITLTNSADGLTHWLWPLHCTNLWWLNHPPGLANAALIWAVLPMLAISFVAPLAYLLAQQWHPSPEKTALFTAALALFVPALAFFAGLMDGLFPPLFLLVALLWHRAMSGRPFSPSWALLAGVLISLLTFLSLSAGVMVVWCGFYALAQKERREWWKLWQTFLLLGLGAASLWLAYWVRWGVSPWAIIGTGLEQHYTLVTHLRSHFWWAIWNGWDLLLFGGLACVVGAVWTGVRGKMGAILWPTLLTLFLLTLSGSSRGEVGRLWIGFFPLIALAVGPALATRPRWAMAAQLSQLMMIGLVWVTAEAVIVTPTPPSQNNDEVYISSFRAEFGSYATLYGQDVTENGDGTWQVTLKWQAHQSAERPYTTFLHLVDPTTGEVVAQGDNWALQGTWPPSCWQPNDQLTDSYQLDTRHVPAGQYQLYVGWYDAQTGQRVPIDQSADSLHLTDLTIR